MFSKILFFLLFTFPLFAQNSFFVKFKESVDLNYINLSIDEVLSKTIELTKSVGTQRPNKNVIKPISKYYLEKNVSVGKIFVVNFENSEQNSIAHDLFLTDSQIEYVEPNNLLTIDYMPNDSLITEQWALETTETFAAWDLTQGSEEILIGIVDTGIDYNNSDLKSNLFVNEIEDLNKNGILDSGDLNGIDDDNNGFTDDVIGWDFTDRIGFPFSTAGGGDYLGWDNDPSDDYGHGTWVAGLIGAVSNNNKGISGFVPKVKMLNVRSFDPTGNGEEDDAAAAILYAVQMGAKVINMSFGDATFSLVLKDVIRFAYKNGVVLVGSAGNSTSSLPHYPSSYDEVISVGATDYRDYLGSFSNTGSTIDLVAPGVNLITTDRNNLYRPFSGTSAAAPVITSAAALLLSVDNFTPEEIRQILKSTSDDLGEQGWDERFGAGRVNIKNAVTVKAPATIKILHPVQDFATNKDSIEVSATILSGYFLKYELSLGAGYNPEEWDVLIEEGKYQFVNKKIFSINTKELPDSVYCLKLKIYLQSGRTLEERVNFYIDRSNPKIELVNLTDAYYGSTPTILGSIFTDEICVSFMHYRIKGESDFKVISLDGFSTNNMFYKQLHYGFIPLPNANPSSIYELYFEAKDLTGISSYLYNENNTYFEIETGNVIFNKSIKPKSYSLPLGRINDHIINLTNNNSKQVLLNPYTNSSVLQIYELTNNSFIKIDSLKNRQIPKSVSDFDKNGKIDFLSYFYPKAFIDEQSTIGSTKFTQKFVDSTAIFRPIMAEDIDSDGNTELLALTNDTTLAIYEIGDNMSLGLENKLYNFSTISPYLNYKNSFGSPNSVVTYGVSGTNNKELWLVDTEGDIMSYNILGANNYSNGVYITTSFFGVKNILSAGDFDGDGQNDLAVLLESSEDLDIAPFKLLIVFNIKNEQLNIIFQKIFIDPSLQFSSLGIKPKSNIKFINLNNNGKDDLVISTYPYFYVFTYESNKTEPILFAENSDIKANEFYYNIFSSDIDNNGLNEFALTKDERINFYEFESESHALTPVNFNGYSLDSNAVFLTWIGEPQLKYYIYKGFDINNLVLIDSTNQNFYNDLTVSNNTNYYYAIKSYDNSKLIKFSDFTSSIEIFTHPKVKIISYSVLDGTSIVLEFSDKINTAILDLNSFILNNGVKPSSISVKSEKSYILSFNPALLNGVYTLQVKNLKDFYRSPIDNQSITFEVLESSELQEFFIESYEIVHGKMLKIVFNLPINISSFENINNYTFNPYNSVTSINNVEENNRTIILNLQNPIGSIGKTYTLKIENVISSLESGNINIKEGSGSYIVLSTNSESLENMYVYPNPFIENQSDGNIYFANLTAKTEIIIFDIKGNRIAEVSENDGNGGVQWNLQDLNGNKVPSGIYLYRAVALDATNNEIEVKIGKFAVTR